MRETEVEKVAAVTKAIPIDNIQRMIDYLTEALNPRVVYQEDNPNAMKVEAERITRVNIKGVRDRLSVYMRQ